MKPAEGDGRPWLEGLFEGAQDTLQRAEDRVSAYMAAKVPGMTTHAKAVMELYTLHCCPMPCACRLCIEYVCTGKRLGSLQCVEWE